MKMPIVALLASFLFGCTGPAYEANFNGIDLGCCIVRDTFDPAQAMQEGNSNLPGEVSDLKPATSAVRMETNPRMGGSGTTSTIGIYRTQLSLGPRTSFLVSATFQNPSRELSSEIWSILLVARTGDAADDPNTPRLKLSLRTVESMTAPGVPSVDLRVQEGPNAEDAVNIGMTKPAITGHAYEDIFVRGRPFTLWLFVNREIGKGFAVLATERQTIPAILFDTVQFKQNAAVPIIVSTVGATLANTGPGKLASVEVTHFEILTDCEGFDFWDFLAGRRCD